MNTSISKLLINETTLIFQYTTYHLYDHKNCSSVYIYYDYRNNNFIRECTDKPNNNKYTIESYDRLNYLYPPPRDHWKITGQVLIGFAESFRRFQLKRELFYL